MTGVPTRSRRARRAGARLAQAIDSAVANDEELSGYVSQLEEQVDESEVMPTGDDLAAELEAFLRDQRGEA